MMTCRCEDRGGSPSTARNTVFHPVHSKFIRDGRNEGQSSECDVDHRTKYGREKYIYASSDGLSAY